MSKSLNTYTTNSKINFKSFTSLKEYYVLKKKKESREKLTWKGEVSYSANKSVGHFSKYYHHEGQA